MYPQEKKGKKEEEERKKTKKHEVWESRICDLVFVILNIKQSCTTVTSFVVAEKGEGGLVNADLPVSAQWQYQVSVWSRHNTTQHTS